MFKVRDGTIEYIYTKIQKKFLATFLSGNYPTYLTISLETTPTMSGHSYDCAKITLRVRNSVREIYIYNNDNASHCKGVSIAESGFITELKYSPSQNKLFCKTYNYAGQPTIYIEKDKEDTFNITSVTHSQTAYVLPSDAETV